MHDHNKFITPINMKYNFLWLLPFLIIWIQMYRNEYLYLFSTHILLNIFDIPTWKMITKEIPIMVKILVPKASPASHYSAWSLSQPVLFWVGLKSSNSFSLLNDSALSGGVPSCCPLLSLRVTSFFSPSPLLACQYFIVSSVHITSFTLSRSYCFLLRLWLFWGDKNFFTMTLVW